MNVASPIERQQAIDYIKARLARLSERKNDLLRSNDGSKVHAANQIKVIDGRVDHLLDALNVLQNKLGEPQPDQSPFTTPPVPSSVSSNNFEGAGARRITGD